MKCINFYLFMGLSTASLTVVVVVVPCQESIKLKHKKIFRTEIALSLFIYLFILIMKECFLCELQFFGCSVDYLTPITISFKTFANIQLNFVVKSAKRTN